MNVASKKEILIIFLLAILLLATTVFYILYKKYISVEPATDQQLPEQLTHNICLGDDETVLFQYHGPRVTATSADIIITDKITGKEKFRFQLDNLSPNIGWPYEFRKCGIYIIKEFNWDYKRSKPLPGFSEELWKYTYDGKGENFLTLTNSDESGKINFFYDYDFRTDFLETYIALIAGSLERIKEYATVIKEIPTKNDVFSLGYQSIIDKHPGLIGFLGLGEWTKDSRYFWGRLSVGASVTAFFRIERDNWNVDTFLTPPHILGGTAFNPEFGYLTYDTGPGWIGIDVITEQVYDEWRKAGKIVELHLYNLFAKKDILLATSTEPSWHGDPRWLSDTELQYELPNGEKKIYKINDR